jgi:hypothetical protein
MDDLNAEGSSGETREMPIENTASPGIRKTESNLKSIHLSGNGFVIKEEAPIRSYESLRLADSGTEIPGAYFRGTQYYDLKNIYFISNAGMASLIELLESLIERDVDVQFVNVCDKIKNRIKSLGLEHIIICS